ncbi:MAG: DNA alkylation response protein, partial [Gammaproteobacteria bacterium]|nr:DNA alkylation response protein [Gammaproteobacteria bacterium]
MTEQILTPGAFATHEVFNQPTPFEDVNLFASDRVLREAVEREGAGHARGDLSSFGARIGSAEIMDLGRQANVWLPVHKGFDRFGHRSDRVEFHPAYHR